MKLVELLKLMHERKAPKNIKFMNKEWKFIKNDEFGDYIIENVSCYELLSSYNILLCLNEFVEIIEEKPKHIEKIDLEEDAKKQHFVVTKQDRILENKINEISKAVNYLLDKEER